MLNEIECCNRKFQGNMFCIGNGIYLICSKCPNCGTYIAEIKTRTTTGGFIKTLRRKNEAATRLYEKYKNSFLNVDYNIFKGTKTKEYEFYNKFGEIYNGNGIKIASNNEFMKMTRDEINAILNKRFFKQKRFIPMR